MNTQTKSPLEALLVSEEEMASEAVTNTLQGLIQIGRESGSLIPTKEITTLDRNTRILVYLLGIRAAATLGRSEKTSASAEEIAAFVDADVKSAREYASRLKGRFLARGTHGYEIPTAKLALACEEINARRKATA